ncbi:hypothetical protein B0D71_23075 [Pseudomonas laurylsulfativorans]|uniref:Uncharacterized protein n=1 Tax=Pseudomonas laurylsulfativorans TaxID=1943631 RepID=A0A2S3VJY0_9PSED|nr:hypothetical protein B0D71_23075 [Pseudomonas laurylsulfativorans]
MNNSGLIQARWISADGVRVVSRSALLAMWLWPTAQRLCVIFDERRFVQRKAALAIHTIWMHRQAIASPQGFNPFSRRGCHHET